MRFVQHPDVARFQVNPGILLPSIGHLPTHNASMGFLGARPGKFCDPPCPGQICCANGACVDSINACLTLTSAQPRKPARRSRSLRRNNPRTLADRLLGVFNLHPRG